MRNPHRSRNIALAFFASGCVAMGAAFLIPGPRANDVARAILFIYGSTTVLFGGGTALFRHFDARAKDALGRGGNLLAQWRVDPEGWRAFVLLERDWNRHFPSFPNELALPPEIPERGVEVLVGSDAVQIDESIHRLPPRGTPEITEATLYDSDPPVIELQLYYPGGGTGASGIPQSDTHTALRFPVASGAWKQARHVVAHFRGELPGRADFFHGGGDGTDPEDLSTCSHCGHETRRFISHCSKCGRGLQSRRWSRRFGAGLLGCGLFITGVMTAVLLVTFPMLLHPGAEFRGARFAGTATQGRFLLALLGGIQLLGVTISCYGLWQIVTGQRSKRAIYFIVGIVILLCVAAWGMFAG